MIIKEVERPSLKKIIKAIKFKPTAKPELLLDVLLVGSGKGAIALVLKYLINKGIIKNKLDEVLMPSWLGYWVYNQIQPYAFPVKSYSSRVKIILAYHQYGFPQKMEKILDFANKNNIVVIEDCAHAVSSSYQGKAVGLFGDYAIYSYSKWLSCFALGGIRAKDKNFYQFAQNLISSAPFGLTFFKDTIKLFSDLSKFAKSKLFYKYSNLLLRMIYAIYDEALKPGRLASKLLYNGLNGEIKLRQERYRTFINKTYHLGICDHLEKEGITPYVIPIICEEAKGEKLIRTLADAGIMTGFRYFDINRNLLEPNYQKSIIIPCHGGITDDQFSNMIEIIIKIV